ncbi:hypothetical protein L484_014763 [Morus notabilis]|uniref:Uncharacterized protein n=1 Tax=Morus notabilis TaxID=981085 RepID=W9QEX0_9ROSA|nr:hypothetical protein L484_014763 [Morus notabilis]
MALARRFSRVLGCSSPSFQSQFASISSQSSTLTSPRLFISVDEDGGQRVVAPEPCEGPLHFPSFRVLVQLMNHGVDRLLLEQSVDSMLAKDPGKPMGSNLEPNSIPRLKLRLELFRLFGEEHSKEGALV